MDNPISLIREKRLGGFDWDDGNRDKCQKHGIAIAVIEGLFAGEIDIRPDLVHSAQEQRFMAVGVADGRPVFLVFTLRERAGEVLIRPISARHMHLEEMELYEKTAPRTQNR